jgi:glycerophosphoryl diester phosphodiesterase
MEDLDRMVRITRSSGMAEVTVFVSSDWVILNRLKQSAPEIQRAYLAGDLASFPEALDRAVVDEGSFMSVEVDLALGNAQGIKDALGSGVELVTWTVNDPSVAQRALEAGIRRFTTDEVTALLAWRNSLG